MLCEVSGCMQMQVSPGQGRGGWCHGSGQVQVGLSEGIEVCDYRGKSAYDVRYADYGVRVQYSTASLDPGPSSL